MYVLGNILSWAGPGMSIDHSDIKTALVRECFEIANRTYPAGWWNTSTVAGAAIGLWVTMSANVAKQKPAFRRMSLFLTSGFFSSQQDFLTPRSLEARG